MKYPLSDFTTGLELILCDPSMRSISVFCGKLSDVKERIRITRRGKKELIITMGRPNFREREFLKLCKKAKTNPRKWWANFYRPQK